MADLTVCYFCGATDGVHTRPVIPGGLDPTDRHQRTVTVCASCDEKLEAVLDPIVDHVTAADGSASGGEPSDRSEAPADPDQDPDDGGVDAAPSGTDAAAGGSTPSEGTSADDDSAPADDRPRAAEADLPDGTRKVLRLLQNRERSIDREGLLDLATNAYGLQYTQAKTVLETLLDRGVLATAEDGSIRIVRD